MSFHKVVKVPAKRAHIKNYPHKKSEARDRRVEWLWGYVKALVSFILASKGESKLFYYPRLREVKQELNGLGFYDEQAMWCIINQARWEHNRLCRW